MNLQQRRPQTQVKHEILSEYLRAWTGIIINGLRRPYSQSKGNFTVRFVYVDGFAYIGRYSDEGGESWVPGSALIGVQALDKASLFAREEVGFAPLTHSFLFEQDQEHYDGLRESLSLAGYANRVFEEGSFHEMHSGGIATRAADYRDHITDVLAFTASRYTWAFYLLDPYGPRGLEMNVVKKIVRGRRHDVMINFPYQDLAKKIGSVRKQTPEHQQHLNYYDRLYGCKEWRDLAQQYAGDELETRLVKLYAQRLQAIDPDLTIKTVPLLFPDKDRTMFYLFLTTHDPTGALTMNRIIFGAKQSEYEYRVQWKTEKELKRVQELSGGLIQQPLFGDQMAGEGEVESERSSEFARKAAELIYQEFRGRKNIKYRDLLRQLAATAYFPEEIEKAIALLKRDDRAGFSSRLNNETLISFK